ncbi:MAG: polysaccharide biosynthesis/export family protein [Gammaproteobacteria bacterium]|nr:polysaccharide biosynthesis/export family protein [Gammaproteobacteria bacterium]
MKKIIGFLLVMFLCVFDVYSETDLYVIGPGDLLSISVWKEEGLQKEVLVKPDGYITFPLVGDIKAGGIDTKMLTKMIVDKLNSYIPNPNVTVSVLQSTSNRVYVIGQVNKPGQFVTSQYMDVLQALTLAGGLTPYADSDNIKILRRTNKTKEIFEFDYDDVVSGDEIEMNIMLKAGDTVVVP